MTIAYWLALYFMIWWTVLFAVLPWGVRTQDEAGEVVPGTPESAPARLRPVRVVVVTSLIAGVLTAIVYVLIVYRPIPLDSIPILRF